MKKLNVCLTIIPLRAAAALNDKDKTHLQSNAHSGSSSFKEEQSTRACSGSKPNSRRAAITEMKFY